MSSPDPSHSIVGLPRPEMEGDVGAASTRQHGSTARVGSAKQAIVEFGGESVAVSVPAPKLVQDKPVVDVAPLIRKHQEASDGESRDAALRAAMSAWDDTDVEGLLALLGLVVRVGRRVVPQLIFKLVSDDQNSRKAAAIALGVIGDPASIAPLCARVLRESSEAWQDMARSIARGGVRAVAELETAERDAAAKVSVTQRQVRCRTVLAEIVASDNQPCGRGARSQIERIALDAESPLSRAATEALRDTPKIRASRRDMLDFARRGDLSSRDDFTARAYLVLHQQRVNLESVLVS